MKFNFHYTFIKRNNIPVGLHSPGQSGAGVPKGRGLVRQQQRERREEGQAGKGVPRVAAGDQAPGAEGGILESMHPCSSHRRDLPQVQLAMRAVLQFPD